MEGDYNLKEFVYIEREQMYRDREKLEYLKTTIRRIKDVLYGKTFPEYEYNDPTEEIKKIVEELENEIGEV